MKHIWKDVFASNTDDGLDIHFENLGKDFFNLYQTLQSSREIQFNLTQKQQVEFNQFFAKSQSMYITIHEDDYIGTVRRLGLTAYRMMMIFSALRIMETGEIPTNIICEEIDFTNTLKIVTVLLKHSSYVYTQTAQEAYNPKPKNRKELFLESLPYHFNRQAYVAVALKSGIPDKSAQRYIKNFIDAGIIQNPAHDTYINPNVTNPQNKEGEDVEGFKHLTKFFSRLK